MNEPQDLIEVPTSALVRCPKVQFNLTPAANCSACTSFSGLADRFPASEHLPFARRFLILCRHEPTKRELFELAESEAA